MKYYPIRILLFLAVIIAAGCSEDDELVQQNPTNYADPLEYLPLKSGNYWVLQTYTNFGNRLWKDRDQRRFV